MLCLSLIAGLLFVPATSANAASFVVTNIDDGGPGSLRQAILDANANPGAGRDHVRDRRARRADHLARISAAGDHRAGVDRRDDATGRRILQRLGPPTLLVRLEGFGAGSATSGLTVSGGIGTVIKGFIFRRFDGDGVSLSSPASGTT